MARGRKPMNRDLVTVPPAVLEPVERSDEQVLADRFAQLERSYSADRDLLNRVIGRIETADAFKQISERVRSGELAVIKENKLFRWLRGRKTPNGSEFQGTWEEFCERILGVSVDKADMDIANVRAFGEQALDAMERAGIGYRQLRDLRRLPADDREAVIAVAQTEDRDALLDVVESLVARKVQAQEEAEAAGQALKDAKEVHRRLMADKAEALNKAQSRAETLQVALHRREQLERSNPDERLKALTGELSGMAAQIAFEIRNNLSRAVQTVREVGEEHGIAVDDAVAAALGMVRRALADTEGDLGVRLSVRYPAPIYPDRQQQEIGQVYGETDVEAYHRELAETDEAFGRVDVLEISRQAVARMREEGCSEEEIRGSLAWQTLHPGPAAQQPAAASAPPVGGLRVVGGRGE